MGKNRTVRLSGGTETGRTVLFQGKRSGYVQRLELSDIPATGGVFPASIALSRLGHYNPRNSKSKFAGQKTDEKSNLLVQYVQNVRLFGIILIKRGKKTEGVSQGKNHFFVKLGELSHPTIRPLPSGRSFLSDAGLCPLLSQRATIDAIARRAGTSPLRTFASFAVQILSQRA